MAGSEEAQVIACHTVDGFNEQLQKGNDSKKLVIFFLIFSVFFKIYLWIYLLVLLLS